MIYDMNDHYFPQLHGFMKHFPRLRSAEMPIKDLEWFKELRENIPYCLSATLQELRLLEDCQLHMDYEYTEEAVLRLIRAFLSYQVNYTFKRIVIRILYKTSCCHWGHRWSERGQ